MNTNKFLSNSNVFDIYEDQHRAMAECRKMITKTKVLTNHKPNVPEVAVKIKASGLKVVGKLSPQKDGVNLRIHRIQLPMMHTYHYLFSSECNDVSSVLPSVGDDLLRYCLMMGSTDNLSVVIVALTSIANQISEKRPPCFDLDA
jgi:hypothetical protein